MCERVNVRVGVESVNVRRGSKYDNWEMRKTQYAFDTLGVTNVKRSSETMSQKNIWKISVAKISKAGAPGTAAARPGRASESRTASRQSVCRATECAMNSDRPAGSRRGRREAAPDAAAEKGAADDDEKQRFGGIQVNKRRKK